MTVSFESCTSAADRRRVQGTPTFAEAATTVIDQKRAGWKTPAQVQAWRGSLERYAFPRIGRRPISEVASADVLAILTPIWHTKPVMAKTVKQRIHTVLEWAIAMNLRTDNPSDRVGPVLGPQRNIVQHMRALPHREVAAALATVRASGAPPAVTLAFEFLVLTAARSGEVRLAAWDEMDTADHVWTIPATRMKMKRDHRVPLCGRALAILAAARTLGDGPLGPVRAAAAAHGRLGRLPHRRTPPGGVVAALTPYRRWGLDPIHAATITPDTSGSVTENTGFSPLITTRCITACSPPTAVHRQQLTQDFVVGDVGGSRDGQQRTRRSCTSSGVRACSPAMLARADQEEHGHARRTSTGAVLQ